MVSKTELIAKINNVIKENFNRIAISLVVMMVISRVVSAILVLPVLSISLGGGGFFGSAITLLLAAASVVVTVFLLYGFSVLVGRFYRNEAAVIGHLFWGFTNDSKRVLICSVLVGLLCILSSIISVSPIIIYVYTNDAFIEGIMATLEADPDMIPTIAVMDALMKLVPISFIGNAVILFAVLFRYSFVFFILYHESELSWKDALKKSRHLLKGRKWKLFCFCLRVAKIPLACTLGLFLLSVLPAGFVQSFSALCTMGYSLSLYLSFNFLIFALAAFYYECADPDTLCLSSPEALQLN